MTNEQVIKLAKQAGCDIAWADSLIRFASLVASHEREECAKLCDALAQKANYDERDALEYAIVLIKARSA